MLLKLILTSRMVMELQLINPFVSNAPRFSDVFREGVEKRCIANKWVKWPAVWYQKNQRNLEN